MFQQDSISILSTKPNQIGFVGIEKVRMKRIEERRRIMTLPGQPAWFGLVDNLTGTFSISKSQSQIPYFFKYQVKLKIVNQDIPGWLTW